MVYLTGAFKNSLSISAGYAIRRIFLPAQAHFSSSGNIAMAVTQGNRPSRSTFSITRKHIEATNDAAFHHCMKPILLLVAFHPYCDISFLRPLKFRCQGIPVRFRSGPATVIPNPQKPFTEVLEVNGCGVCRSTPLFLTTCRDGKATVPGEPGDLPE